MIIAVAAIAILFNTFFAKKLPLIEGVILIIHVFGFFGILVGNNRRPDLRHRADDT